LSKRIFGQPERVDGQTVGGQRVVNGQRGPELFAVTSGAGLVVVVPIQDLAAGSLGAVIGGVHASATTQLGCSGHAVAGQRRRLGTSFGTRRRTAYGAYAAATAAPADHATNDATLDPRLLVVAGVHEKVRQRHVNDRHDETRDGEHHGENELPSALGQVQFGDDDPRFHPTVIARVRGPDDEVPFLEHAAVQMRRVPATLDVGEDARVRVRPSGIRFLRLDRPGAADQ